MKFIQPIRPEEMKVWQDCSWRRIACGRKDCPICGPEEERRLGHIEKGETPDSLEAAFFDLTDIFTQTKNLLSADAKKMGIDLTDLPEEEEEEPAPRPETYPIYNEVADWMQGIYKISEESDEVSSAWLYTEAGDDLLWYARTLKAKILRQLRTFWEIDKGKDYLDLECAYTGYVLNEVFKILRGALTELIVGNFPQAQKFTLAWLVLTGIEEKMRKMKTIQ